MTLEDPPPWDTRTPVERAREELALLEKWEEAAEWFRQMKATDRGSPEYEAAAKLMREMRSYHRQIREFLAPITPVADGDAVAAPPPVATSSALLSGRGYARPEPAPPEPPPEPERRRRWWQGGDG